MHPIQRYIAVHHETVDPISRNLYARNDVGLPMLALYILENLAP